MNSYSIDINIVRLLHYSVPKKYRYDNQTLLMLLKSFSSYVKDLYITMIYEAINSPRYYKSWEPVDDPGYVDYLGVTPTKNILDLMQDSLEVRVVKENIVVRFDPKYRYPKSNRTLLEVLNAIDKGTTKFNARPIFRRIIRTLESKLPSLWRSYVMRKGVRK